MEKESNKETWYLLVKGRKCLQKMNKLKKDFRPA